MKKFLIALMISAMSTAYAAEVVTLDLAESIELALKNNQTIA